ncbi:MAG TPA: adenosylcobinamide amidohydrolase [Acidimicrobiia bacterium]|nr:adenosylcobinamide amidohydrolase [Acidimicrobiia bacterium]
MKPAVAVGVLRVDLGRELRCLSSAVLGGGLGRVRTWVNLQVPSGYARTDPGAHLAEETAGLAGPVLGMLTAAPVDRFQDVVCGTARAFATVGLGYPVAAAAGEPGPPGAAGAPPAGTINILAVVPAPLTDAGLVGAVQTAVEAKVQALAAAGVLAGNAPGFATGTASDVIAVACPPGSSVAFAGPATPTGSDLARAVFEAVRLGSLVSGRG